MHTGDFRYTVYKYSNLSHGITVNVVRDEWCAGGWIMRDGVEAKDKMRDYEPLRIYFPNPQAAFPVALDDGTDLGWARWGQRQEQPGSGPQRGWTKLETIERGGWRKYQPQSGLALVSRFMEKDANPTSHWFDLADGQGLECLVIGEPDDRRACIVTTPPLTVSGCMTAVPCSPDSRRSIIERPLQPWPAGCNPILQSCKPP